MLVSSSVTSPVFSNRCAAPAGTTTVAPPRATTSAPSTVNVASPEATMNTSGYACRCSEGPRPGSMWTSMNEASTPCLCPSNVCVAVSVARSTAVSNTSGSATSHLPVVVVDPGRARRQVPVLGRAREHLVAVGIDAHRHLGLRREHQHPHGLRAAVGHLVRARRAGREGHHLERAQLRLALGRAHDHDPVERHQPLLLRILVVVGADALPGRDLVDRSADLGGPDLGAEAVHPGAVALGVAVVVLGGRGQQVEAFHAPEYLTWRPRRWPSTSPPPSTTSTPRPPSAMRTRRSAPTSSPATCASEGRRSSTSPARTSTVSRSPRPPSAPAWPPRSSRTPTR